MAGVVHAAAAALEGVLQQAFREALASSEPAAFDTKQCADLKFLSTSSALSSTAAAGFAQVADIC